MKTPNLFLVGAPKCGTTALAKYLAEHDEVFFSSPKEPNYFARHMWITDALRTVASFRNSLDHYLALFERADPERHAVVADGSVFYLSSRQSLEEIRAFAPEAKIVAMLRNPVDLVYSLHAELCLHLVEDQEDFEKAWHLQTKRAEGQNIPLGALRVEPLLYGQVGRLGQQVHTLLEVFPSDQVMTILFDDFKRDPEGTYRQVIDFLDISHDGRDSFPVVNPNQQARATPLMRLVKQNQKLRLVSEKLKGLVGVQSWGIFDWMQRRSKTTIERSPLSAEFRAELIAYFADDIALLEQTTGRDLSDWTAPKDRAHQSGARKR